MMACSKLITCVISLIIFPIVYSLECDSNEYSLAVINFGHLQSSNPKIRKKEEKSLLNAMENIGFMVITNHGISKEVMDQTWNVTREFFDTSSENKNEVHMTPEYMYGYTAEEILSYSETIDEDNNINNKTQTKKDEKETFNVWIGAPNKPKNTKWPKQPSNMKEIYTKYYRNCERIAAGILQSFANVLDLPGNYFDNKIDDHMSVLRSLNYPQQNTSKSDTEGLRCSAHTDYGTMTLLRQDNIGGLQVEKNGQWLDISSDHYDFVVNLGDLMQRWTNNRFKSTRHRVVNSKNIDIENRRQSIAFFHNLNGDAIVETIPSCLDENGESKYTPIEFLKFLEMKHHSTQTHYDIDEIKNEL